MASALSVFVPYAQPSVAGAPMPMIEAAIREGCRQFSADTWLIKSDATVPTVAATQYYSPTVTSGSEMIGVKTVVINGDTRLQPTQEDTARRYVQADGTPTHFWVSGGYLWLYPTPDAVVSLAVEVVERPTQSAATVDDKYVEHREAIAAFARYKLLGMTGMSWTDPQGSRDNYILFKSLVGEQLVRDNRGRVPTNLRVVPNFF